MNEFPDFLSGEERENTQHIAVTYWTSEIIGKRWSFRKSRKSPRPGSAATDYGDRSNASTPLGFASQDNWSEDFGYATQSMSSLQVSARPDSRGSVGSNRESNKSSKKKKSRLGESGDESALKSLKEELEENLLEDIEEDNTLGYSTMSTGNFKVSRRESQRSHKSINNEKPSQKTNAPDTLSQTGSVTSVRPLPKGPKKGAFENESNANVDEKNAKNEKLNENYLSNPGTVDEKEKSFFCCCACFNCFKGKNQILPFCGGGKGEKNDNMADYPLDYFTPEKNGPPPDIVNLDIKSDVSKVQKGSMLSLNDAVTPSRRSSITTIRVPSRSGTPGLDSEPTFTRSVRYVYMWLAPLSLAC